MKMYKFNNRKHQHDLMLADTKLRNMMADAAACGNYERVAQLRGSWERLDAACEAAGVFNTPHMLEVPYDVWRVLNAAAKWACGCRAVACEREGVDYID